MEEPTQILQKRIIPTLHYALDPRGFLLLGSSETVGGFSELFNTVDSKYKIYAKKAIAGRHRLDIGLRQPAGKIGKIIHKERESEEKQMPFDLQKEANNLVLNRYAPAGVLVSDSMEVIQFRGQTGRFLEHSPGKASFNLLNMAREGLGMEIRNAVDEAGRADAPVTREGIRVRQDGEFFQVKLDVHPLRSPAGEVYFMVLFSETGEPEETSASASAARQPGSPGGKLPSGARKEPGKVAAEDALRRELEATKRHLQNMIEEKEHSNEELRAANEEIQSSNEELQSINEEVETAKEELQSTNEELTTVNEELQTRNQQLTQAADDMANLLNSIDMPVIMLDSQLRIRRFTPGAGQVLNLIPGDIGRPVDDIKLNIEIPQIDDLAHQVMENMSAEKREIQNRDGDWFLMRVRPYRTADNKIDGAVFTFTEIGELKRALDSNLEARKLSDALNEINLEINSVRDIDDILATVLERGGRAIGAEASIVSQRRKKGWRILISAGFPEDVSGVELPDRENRVATEAADSHRPVLVDDVAGDKRAQHELVSRFGIKSVLAIPLMVRGKDIFGTVEFFFLSKAVGFSQEMVDFAAKLAASVSLAMDNAELIQQHGAGGRREPSSS